MNAYCTLSMNAALLSEWSYIFFWIFVQQQSTLHSLSQFGAIPLVHWSSHFRSQATRRRLEHRLRRLGLPGWFDVFTATFAEAGSMFVGRIQSDGLRIKYKECEVSFVELFALVTRQVGSATLSKMAWHGVIRQLSDSCSEGRPPSPPATVPARQHHLPPLPWRRCGRPAKHCHNITTCTTTAT